MMTKHNTIDIYETEEWPETLKGVFIYSENEYGCASHIAMKALLGDAKPAGRILTHLINQMVFNQTKDYEDVGWEYYFYAGTLIININKWPQTPIMPLHEAQATWINCYPPVRDLLSFIKDKYDNTGFVAYVTSTTLHDSLNTDIFAIHPPEHLMAYSHKGSKKISILPKHKLGIKGDLFFTPPAWMFPHLANKMGFDGATTIFSGHDPESGDIDELAALTLFRWANKATGNLVNKHSFNRSLKSISTDIQAALTMRDELEKLLASADEHSEAPNMLWG
tara:strand:+ start:1913 stop:2749 length:837 start_codon:yes stop_codon:yes gene_type:complete